MNMLNRRLSEVHLLTESSCQELRAVLGARALTMALSLKDGWRFSVEMENKLICAQTASMTQPLYADFFRYANTTLSSRVVILANADVVFDDTLKNIDWGRVLRQEHGYVLSVSPPPQNGDYKRVFLADCDNTPRCAVGSWQRGGKWAQGDGAGSSWDAFVFAPPLLHYMNLSHIQIKMNLNGAENMAAYQLEVNGNLTLYNPCFHIHAYHWHCKGGKMHDTDPTTRADQPPWLSHMLGLPVHFPYDAVDAMLPCWNCPGVIMPPGAVSSTNYCKYGKVLGIDDVPALRKNFRVPWLTVGVCCNECAHLDVENLPHCINSTDVDCVTWEFNSDHHYY